MGSPQEERKVLVWGKMKKWSGAVWPRGARFDMREMLQVGGPNNFWINMSMLLLGYTKRDNEEITLQSRESLECGGDRAGSGLWGGIGMWEPRMQMQVSPSPHPSPSFWLQNWTLSSGSQPSSQDHQAVLLEQDSALRTSLCSLVLYFVSTLRHV